jgi:hypothetical protein
VQAPQPSAGLVKDGIFFGKAETEEILSSIVMIESFPRDDCHPYMFKQKLTQKLSQKEYG